MLSPAAKKIIIVHGVHITTPAGGSYVPPAFIVLQFSDAFVTVTDRKNLITCDNQIGIHQAGQTSYNHVANVRGNQPHTFFIEITNDGAVVISLA